MSGPPNASTRVEVLRNRVWTSKHDVIRAIGDAMLAASAITPAYVEGMLRKEQQGATIVMPGVALPHGTSDVRDAVLRNVLVIVPIPSGVEWAPGEQVRLVIGFAGKGDREHLRVMGSLARLLSDPRAVSRLMNADDRGHVADLLEGTTAPDGTEGNEVSTSKLTSTMKAAVFFGPGDLRVGDVPRPRIAETELLVRVAACGVCGSDVRTFRSGARNISRPVVLGHELSGTIIEAGASVGGFHVGQRVAVAPAIPCGECGCCRLGAETMCENLRSIGYEFDGGLAELIAVPSSAVRAGCVNTIPERVSFEEAAIAEPLACVINAQELARVSDGDTVVVLGAGPVGCLHTGLAKVRGAAKIMLVDIRSERLQLAAQFGADVLIDGSSEDVLTRVLEETAGRGASVVIVAAPSHAAAQQAVTLAARRGRVNLFAGLPKNDPMISINGNVVHYRELSLVGSYGSRPVHNRMALELVASGHLQIRPLVGLELPLERVLDGLHAIEQGRVLKVVVRP